MKITDTLINMLISSVLKKGITGESKNVELSFDVPQEGKNNIKISIKAENVVLKIDRD